MMEEQKLFRDSFYRSVFWVLGLMSVMSVVSIFLVQYYFSASSILKIVEASHFFAVIILISNFTVAAIFISLHRRGLSECTRSFQKFVRASRDLTHMIHDLKSPLAALRVGIQSLKTVCDEDDLNESISLLQLSANRIDGIIQGCLAESPSAYQEIDAGKILRDVVREHQLLPNLKGVRFVVDVADDLIVNGSKNLIERVFTNIIKNSIEAMKHSGTITCLAQNLCGKIQLQITDTGPGMTSQQIAAAQNGSLGSSKKDGQGIGLKFVKEAIQKHGGELHIASSSALQGGTIFKITLPLTLTSQYRNEVSVNFQSSEDSTLLLN